jgi:hypothetical protein
MGIEKSSVILSGAKNPLGFTSRLQGNEPPTGFFASLGMTHQENF